MQQAAQPKTESAPRRVAVLVFGIAVASLISILAVTPLLGDRGVPGPLASDSLRPFLAITVLLICFAAMVAIGAVVGRLVNALVGLFVVGAGLGVLSMRTGTVEDLVFGTSVMRLMPLETAVWALLLALASILIFRFSGRLPDFPVTHEVELDATFGRAARKSWFAGILAPILASFLVVSAMKGQSIGAAAVASLLVGVVGRVLAPHTQPVVLVAAPLLAAAVGQAFFVFNGLNAPADLFVSNKLPSLLFVMPLDWAVGSLVGVPMGFAWARSFVRQEH